MQKITKKVELREAYILLEETQNEYSMASFIIENAKETFGARNGYQKGRVGFFSFSSKYGT